MALTTWETFILSDEMLFSRTKIENQEYYHQAMEQKKGALLVTGHFGNWETAARILPMRGISLAMIAKRQRNKYFDNYVNKIRTRHGAKLIFMTNALRPILDAIAKNCLIAILIDQNAGKRGVLSDFLGKPASHWKGAAKIALRFNIPILPAVAIREENDLLIIRLGKVLDVSSLPDTEENVMELIKQMNAFLEEYIRQYPHLWFWVHKRWKGAKYLLDS